MTIDMDSRHVRSSDAKRIAKIQRMNQNLNTLDIIFARRRRWSTKNFELDKMVSELSVITGIARPINTGNTEMDHRKATEYLKKLRDIRSYVLACRKQRLTYDQTFQFYERTMVSRGRATFEDLLWNTEVFGSLEGEYDHFILLVRLYPPAAILRHIKKLDLFGMAFYEACQKEHDYIDRLIPDVSFENVMTIMHKKLYRLQLAGITWPDDVLHIFRDYPIS